MEVNVFVHVNTRRIRLFKKPNKSFVERINDQDRCYCFNTAIELI